jgi:glycosyltransferase involved in cell wall biosynthesis
MAAPLVSVVVPTYNRVRFLDHAIESALGQTHPEVEVIVVDDGSTDETPVAVKRWAGNPRVRYIRQENRGVSSARNTGFANSRGAYVALLDSDDVWEPWKLELQVACMERFPDVGMTWTDMDAIDAEGRLQQTEYLRTMYSVWNEVTLDELFTKAVPLSDIAPALGEKVRNKTFYTGDIFSYMVLGNIVHTSTVVLRRSRLDQVGSFDEAFRYAGEDYDFHLRTCKLGPVGLLDLVTIRYTVGNPDAISAKGLEMAEGFLLTLTRTLREDRTLIRLSASRISWALADANAWVGEELMERGRSGAPKHLVASLRYRPNQPRTLKLLALSLLPTRMVQMLRRALGKDS